MRDFRHECFDAVKRLYGEYWMPEEGQETLIFNAERGIKAFTGGNETESKKRKKRKYCTELINGIKRKRLGGILMCGISSLDSFKTDKDYVEETSMAVETLQLLEQLKTTSKLINFLYVNKVQALLINFHDGSINDSIKSIMEHDLNALLNRLHCIEHCKSVTAFVLKFSSRFDCCLPQQLAHHILTKTSASESEALWLSLAATLIGICTYCEPVPGLLKYRFITPYQHDALHSEKNKQILVGPDRQVIFDTVKLIILQGKSIELLLVSSENKAELYATFLKVFDIANQPQILVCTSDESEQWELVAQGKSMIIDSVTHLTFNQRKWLAERKWVTVVIVDDDICGGLQHPDKTISWHRLVLPTAVVDLNDRISNIPLKECFDEHRFFEQAQFWLDCTYPTWKDIIAVPFEKNTETISIPDAIDVLPNKFLGPTNPAAAGYDKKTVKEAKSQIKGFQAEEKFVREFRRLKLGGILISGFETGEFIKIMNRRIAPGFDTKQDMESWIQHFECDALFIHQSIGIYIIEVKACNEYKIAKRCSKAMRQLATAIQGLKEIYCKVSDKVECEIPIHGVIAFPSAIVSENTTQNQRPNSNSSPVGLYEIIDKALLENYCSFKQFWERKLLKQELNISEAAGRFIAALIAYRSAVFVSPASNALEIYRIIDQQDFTRKNSKQSALGTQTTPPSTTIFTSTVDFKTEPGKTLQFFLNQQQLHAVECQERCVLIFGPPGTGKTICVLLRALRAAVLRKRGRVIMISMNGKHLIAKFEQFFHKNRSIIKRQVLVIDESSSLKFDYDDDVFCDEASAEVLKTSFSSLKNRSSKETTGQTIIVITGRRDPRGGGAWDLQGLEMELFFKINLKTVIRGTRTIIEKWTTELAPHSMCFGHNVTGAPIGHIRKLNGLEQTLCGLCSKIKEFLTSLPASERQILEKEGKMFDYQFAPRHIAILTESKQDVDESVSLIKTYLASEGYPCGSIEEQIYEPSLIAVDRSLSAASYEWPAVIVVAESENFAPERGPINKLLAGRPVGNFDALRPKFSEKTTQRELLVGLTRGIAKLIVVEGTRFDVKDLWSHGKRNSALNDQIILVAKDTEKQELKIAGDQLFKRPSDVEPQITCNKEAPETLQLSCEIVDCQITSKNLIQNPSGEQGLFGWTFLKDSRNLWKVESPPEGCKNIAKFPTAFATSHKLCSKQQKVDLIIVGFTAEFLDKSRPIIVVSEWFTSRVDCPSEYEFKTWLVGLDEEGKSYNYDVRKLTRSIAVGENWELAEHIYEQYPAGIREVVLQSSGKDSKNWAGHFGVKTAGASIFVSQESNEERKENEACARQDRAINIPSSHS